MKGLVGIGHVALRVKEIGRSLDFYVEKLGFEEMFRLDHPDTGKLWIVYLRVTDTQFVELFSDAKGTACRRASWSATIICVWNAATSMRRSPTSRRTAWR